MLPPKRWLKRKKRENNTLSVQSSLSSSAQNYLHKCKDTYFILQNKYLRIYKDSPGANILRDDCTLSIQLEMLLRLETIIYILMAIYYP